MLLLLLPQGLADLPPSSHLHLPPASGAAVTAAVGAVAVGADHALTAPPAAAAAAGNSWSQLAPALTSLLLLLLT
jgi:hypothetical protein